MEPGADSRDVGRHMLGPHVVGSRVVVRRLVPGETGPTGGPAFTDVLGVCTAWGEGRCVVETDRGTVQIRLADIVSGKPVPPRPSVRSRVSAAEAESHVSALFPGLATEPLGAWTLRSQPAPVGRLRRRANSCLAMGDPGVPFADAERTIREWYAARSRAALVQVERDSSVERSFRGSGWQPLGDGDADFRVAALSRVSRALRPRRGSRPATVGLTVEGVRASLELRTDGEPVATAMATMSGDWLGVHGLHVSPDHRRRGLALRAMDELVEWGAEQGALTVWLHVETDNGPAAALYESLGFGVHHTCRYLTPTG